MLDNLVHRVKVWLQDRAEYKVVRAWPNQWRALAALLGDLPPDLAAQLGEFMRERGYEVPAAIKSPGARTAGTRPAGTRPANTNRRKR
jgi:hypothetical protein